MAVERADWRRVAIVDACASWDGLTETATLATGSRLGPYDIQSAFGAGGMGEVSRAHDTKLGRDVARKSLPDRFVHAAFTAACQRARARSSVWEAGGPRCLVSS